MAISILAEAAPVLAKKAEKPPGKKSSHPPTSEMVNSAISTLNERKGSSLPAIKKYIVSNYSVELDRLQSSFIKKYLRTAVEKKTIVQTTGVGASGRFKLAKLEKKPKVQVAEGKAASAKRVAKKSDDRPTKQRVVRAAATSRAAETRRKKASASSASKTKRNNKVPAPVATKLKKTAASSKSKSSK